ncbi:HIT family protein [uncultured Tyzzerella sp.]|uniref:HIT family protein n=1 Tax=uncultured Tyzzerella sp. TaxID=2321398 RepID=UPI0029436820|nr:HIT family protein [uncultured Tyzzerella sp.]
MDCIFCKILNGDIPSKKVFENDNFIAILDAFPANEGHTLVIPKKHFTNIFEIDEETLKEGYSIARNVANSIRKSLNIENINILQNNGALAGQTVNHFHIHIIPRLENDTVTMKSIPVTIDSKKMEQIALSIKDNM